MYMPDNNNHGTVKHMEDKVKNQGVIFHSRLPFEHHIKSLCSRLNGTLYYLNRINNTLDQKSRILLINAYIFSHLNYCSSIWGKCSEKLQYKVQKCINFTAKVTSNVKYLKRDHVTPLLRDMKRINVNFDLWNKVSQRITRNGSDDMKHMIASTIWAFSIIALLCGYWRFCPVYIDRVSIKPITASYGGWLSK